MLNYRKMDVQAGNGHLWRNKLGGSGMLENYKTIYASGEGEITEKKSRFIATVRLVEKEKARPAWTSINRQLSRRGRSCFYRRNEEEILGRQT